MNLSNFLDLGFNKFEKKFNSFLSKNVNSFNDKITLVLVGDTTSSWVKFCGYHLNIDYDDHQILLDLLYRWGKKYHYHLYATRTTYKNSYLDEKYTLMCELYLKKVK